MLPVVSRVKTIKRGGARDAEARRDKAEIEEQDNYRGCEKIANRAILAIFLLVALFQDLVNFQQVDFDLQTTLKVKTSPKSLVFSIFSQPLR